MLYRRRRCGAPAQCYSPVHHSPAVHCGKHSSAPSQSYRKGGGLAAAAATVLYRRRGCGVARTVSHDNGDSRFRTAVQMSSSMFYFYFLYKSTLCNGLDGSFDRLSLHFVFPLEKALSAHLSIFSISIARVALSAPSACYAVVVLYCFSMVPVAAVPKGLASLPPHRYHADLQAYRPAVSKRAPRRGLHHHHSSNRTITSHASHTNSRGSVYRADLRVSQTKHPEL